MSESANPVMNKASEKIVSVESAAMTSGSLSLVRGMMLFTMCTTPLVTESSYSTIRATLLA